MTVARILAAKGHDVVAIQPHNTVTQAVKLLGEKGIGAIVVVDASRRVLGILSERDVMRALARDGVAALDEAVSRYMTAKVFTVSEDASVESVMATMTNGRFRHVPVVVEGALVGLVSIGDVVKHHIDDIESEHRALRDYIATA